MFLKISEEEDFLLRECHGFIRTDVVSLLPFQDLFVDVTQRTFHMDSLDSHSGAMTEGTKRTI